MTLTVPAVPNENAEFTITLGNGWSYKPAADGVGEIIGPNGQKIRIFAMKNLSAKDIDSVNPSGEPLSPRGKRFHLAFDGFSGNLDALPFHSKNSKGPWNVHGIFFRGKDFVSVDSWPDDEMAENVIQDVKDLLSTVKVPKGGPPTHLPSE